MKHRAGVVLWLKRNVGGARSTPTGLSRRLLAAIATVAPRRLPAKLRGGVISKIATPSFWLPFHFGGRGWGLGQQPINDLPRDRLLETYAPQNPHLSHLAQ